MTDDGKKTLTLNLRLTNVKKGELTIDRMWLLIGNDKLIANLK